MAMGRWCLAALLIGAVTHAHAATPAAIDKAIAAGREFIYKQQKNGNWENVAAPEKSANDQSPNNGNFTGQTALAVLALINSGESSSDARIKPAIDFLIKTPANGVYALGLRSQVWLAIPSTAQTKEAAQRDAKLLLASMKTAPVNARGMYDYTLDPKSKDYSHSRSQYGVLGMWAAAQGGMEVSDAYWKIVEDGWKRNQDKSGGWTYTNPADDSRNIPVTPGMTTVGVATLFITQEYLRAQDGVSCRGNQTNEAIEKGIKWLGEHMDLMGSDKKYDRDFPFPTLYAFERVGVASGLRYFNGIDWYEKGSNWALTKQSSSGAWNGGDGGAFSPLSDTCFAMLFLCKGRAPIVISKLQYNETGGKEAKWNQRARDAANLVRWTGRTIERDLSFQVVDLKASLADMLESPLLYMAGNDAVNLSEEDKAKIKAFIEGGGILVGNADCGSAPFANSFKKLGKDLFPESEFGELPQDHIIYTNYYPRSKWKTKPSVLVLENGARLQMVLFPQADPAKAWQLQDAKSKMEMFELPADILLYAVDRQNLRYRGERFYIPEDPAAKPTRAVTVARIKYAGFWDPEPGGWRRLNNDLSKRKSLSVTTKIAELGKNELGANKIAHLTGTFEHKFNDAEKDELKKFVDGGGTLIIDACGGSPKFAASVETALAEMYPDQKLEMLPPDHALYKAGGGEPDVITYRNYAIRNGVGRTEAPRLQGITLKDRLAIIYSREDLSVGLVGQAVDGIVGYSPQTSTALMTRILHLAGNLAEWKAPAKPAVPAAPAAPAAPKKDAPKKDPEKKDAPKK
jgi:hypothetical protein